MFQPPLDEIREKKSLVVQERLYHEPLRMEEQMHERPTKNNREKEPEQAHDLSENCDSQGMATRCDDHCRAEGNSRISS